MSVNYGAQEPGLPSNREQTQRRHARLTFSSGEGKQDHTAVFFNHSNEEGNKARTQLATETLESLIDWLKAEGNVGIMGELPWLLAVDRTDCSKTPQIVPLSGGKPI